MKVNLISESEFTVQGHGVHTAYVEMYNGLKSSWIEVEKNGKTPADIVHIHTVGPYALCKLLFSSGKKVVSAHVIPESFIGSLKWARYWWFLAKIWLKFFYKKADVVMACSGMVAKNLREKMQLHNVDVLYNAIDMSKYEFTQEEKQQLREKLWFSSSDTIVLWNGQIQPRKKFDVFVKMAQNFPQVKFIWVGGMPFKSLGAESSKMQNLLQNLPKNLQVTGVIDLSDVRQYFVIADIFVLPSTQENHPMAVLEAAWAGLPILLRDIPEYDDTFRGFVAMAKSDDDFAVQLWKILSDENFKQQLRKGSSEIKKRFSTDYVSKILIEKYKKIL